LKAAWTGFLLSLSLCLDLGIVNVAVLRTVLRQGGTAGFVLGVGSCVGDLAYFTLAVFGTAALVQWTPVRWTLWLAGTAVLLYLAWRMARETLQPRELHLEGALGDRQSGATLFASGIGLALASPSAILWFAAVGGSVIASFGADRRNLAAFAGGFFAAGMAWSIVLAYGLAGVRRLMGPRLIRILSLVSMIVFLYLAGVVFIDGLRLVRPATPGLPASE
jgi:L-lysine exporter family protein LysE/ArgO